MAVAVGQRCVVRIQIKDMDLRNARAIMATIVSPPGEEKCQYVSFDEVSGVVYASVDVNSAGNWSMWLCVRFANEVLYTPSFVFADVDGDAKPCDVPYVVDVEVQGESVSVTPPKIDVDAVTREEFDRLSKDVAGKVDKVAGKGLSTNDYTDTEKAKVAEIEGLKQSIEGKANTNGNYPNMTVGKAQGVVGINQVQEALTLTTKPNGNIVIGNLAGQSKEFMPATPSGDPMHYAYEAEGAVYNGTDAPLEKKDWYGQTIIHEPHKWYLNGLGDLSNKEMAKTYSLGRFSPTIQSPLGYGSNTYPDYATTVRTNIARLGMYNGSVSNSYFAAINYVIETINVSIASQIPQGFTNVNSYYAFNNCQALRSIYGVLKLSGDALTTFVKCYKLQDIKISSLSVSVSFADSPLLSKESLLYMINNCASNATFTITLHPDVYDNAKDSWVTEIEDAIEVASINKGTTITLASA